MPGGDRNRRIECFLPDDIVESANVLESLRMGAWDGIQQLFVNLKSSFLKWHSPNVKLIGALLEVQPPLQLDNGLKRVP